MKSHSLSLLVLWPIILNAQITQDAVHLRFWPAPLYWQPSHIESRGTAKLHGLDNPNTTDPSTISSLAFVAMTPCRVVDTRSTSGFTGAFGPPSLVADNIRSFPIQASSTCSIPSTAQAYSFNVTAVPPGILDYLAIWPTGTTQPVVSTLNSLLGTIVANAAIVPAGNDVSGSVDVFVTDNTDVIIDINGYYAPQSTITLVQATAGTPSLSFSGDPTTGLFSSGTGMVNIVSGGASALWVGGVNTAVGLGALGALGVGSTGVNNTATGDGSLATNNGGNNNTANGFQALNSNSSGNNNTASGFLSLYSNLSGSSNTANGGAALYSNSTGSNNLASGINALLSNTTGNNNTANGGGALYLNTSGSNNVATGTNALENNTVGSNNIAIGQSAALEVAAGNSNNIHVGSQGASADTGTIRIGDLSGPYTSFFVSGVGGVTTGNNDAIPVVIDSAGQLGTISSSIRFKEDVQDMGDASSGLLRLRPVTYRYKKRFVDGSKPLDYGLIAEEVAVVYPNLVVKGGDGQLQTIQYQKLTPMLLNEVQKQNEAIQMQNEKLRLLQTELDALKSSLFIPK